MPNFENWMEEGWEEPSDCGMEGKPAGRNLKGNAWKWLGVWTDRGREVDASHCISRLGIYLGCHGTRRVELRRNWKQEGPLLARIIVSSTISNSRAFNSAEGRSSP